MRVAYWALLGCMYGITSGRKYPLELSYRVRKLLGCGLFHASTHPHMPQLGPQSASDDGMASLALLSEQLQPPLDPYVQGHVGTLERGAPRQV